jgi:DNA-binding GntR family transcriptional regulator
MSVSSTPVREALIRLQTEALLDTAPRRGFFAKMLDEREMTDLFHLRFAILRFAIENMCDFGEKSAAVLDSLFGRTGPDNKDHQPKVVPGQGEHGNRADPKAALILAEQLSLSIVALAENETMFTALRNINERTHYIRSIDLETSHRVEELNASMDAIPTCLRAGDAAGALLVLRRDLAQQIAVLPALVKEGVSRAYLRPSWTKQWSAATASRATHRPIVAGRGSTTRR